MLRMISARYCPGISTLPRWLQFIARPYRKRGKGKSHPRRADTDADHWRAYGDDRPTIRKCHVSRLRRYRRTGIMTNGTTQNRQVSRELWRSIRIAGGWLGRAGSDGL